MNPPQPNERVRRNIITEICGTLSTWPLIVIFAIFNVLLFFTLVLRADIFTSFRTVTSSHLLLLVFLYYYKKIVNIFNMVSDNFCAP